MLGFGETTEGEHFSHSSAKLCNRAGKIHNSPHTQNKSKPTNNEADTSGHAWKMINWMAGDLFAAF